MNIIIDPKKNMDMLTKQYIFIYYKHIKYLSITETYEYLGIQIGPIYNYINAIVNTNDTKLINLSKSLLKLQQRYVFFTSYCGRLF